MRKRTAGRECALQLLYQWDLTKSEPDDIVTLFWASREEEAETRAFAEQLLRGTVHQMAIIDQTLEKYAENWALTRMAVVDRNILRLGTYELLFIDEIPSKVTINEAVELAKRFGDVESSKFINGILDKIHKTVAPQKRVPAVPPSA
jgi:N utilization substance protein B